MMDPDAVVYWQRSVLKKLQNENRHKRYPVPKGPEMMTWRQWQQQLQKNYDKMIAMSDIYAIPDEYQEFFR